MQNQKTTLLILFIIGILPFEINGFYNPHIVNFSLLYWVVEIFTWILLPGFVLIYGIKNNIYKVSDLGLTVVLKKNYNKAKNLLLFLLLIFFTSILLFYSFKYIEQLFKEIFTTNYLEIDFKYSYTIPQKGAKRIIIALYYALTAAFIEEFYYRALFWKLVKNLKRNVIIYIFLSSFIFASVHWEGGIINIFTTFFYGIICSIIFVKTKNLWPLIIGHFVTDYFLFI